MLRAYNLAAAREAVLKAARLRKPQRESFEFVHKLVESFDTDLPNLEEARLRQVLNDAGVQTDDWPPEMVFELATGVGKTRLMGSLISYLFRAGQSRNALILAPRTAIVEKLEREAVIGSSKYLLVDPALVPTANICVRSSIESFAPSEEGLNLFILTPQSITGGDRRFSKRTDYGGSLEDYLKGAPDLVVYIDESHHIPGNTGADATAWKSAVESLKPKLQFGFSATPGDAPKATVVYSYPLGECLRDAQYTKAVKLWVEQAPEGIDDIAWDRTTVDFGLQRLLQKRNALVEYTAAHDELDFIEPVMLIAARDTAHADEIASWLFGSRGLTEGQVHVAHSNKNQTEEEIRKLVAIDRPGNQIRVVVNVFQLSEGWDVTNVYVVTPLRSMATYQNAIQSMGRGLRLPAGQRTGEDEIDTLDVLCFGKESFETIVHQAITDFGEGVDGSSALAIEHSADAENAEPRKPMTIKLKTEVCFEAPRVERIPPEPDLAFDITRAPEVRMVSGINIGSMDRVAADQDELRYPIEHVVADATRRVLATLQYLSPAIHQAPVAALVRNLLKALGATDATTEVAVDPLRCALLVAGEIDRRFRALAPTYVACEGAQSFRAQAFDWPVPESLDRFVEKSTVRDWQ